MQFLVDLVSDFLLQTRGHKVIINLVCHHLPRRLDNLIVAKSCSIGHHARVAWTHSAASMRHHLEVTEVAIVSAVFKLLYP